MKSVTVSISTALLLCAGALCAQSPKPLTSVATFHVAPGKVASFVNRGKAITPALDKLMAAGTVLAYGIDVDMLHVPGTNNVAFWLEAADFAGIGQAEAAIDEFAKAHPDVMGDLFSMSDPATHHDFIVRSLESKAGKAPAGVMPTVDFDIVTVKEGQMDAFMELFRKYDKPVLDKLVDDGVIYSYSVDVEAVHTMKPGTVWTIVSMPDLGGKDKVRAAFQESMKKVPEAERNMMDKLFEGIVEPGSHRDSLAVSVVFKTK